MINIMEVTETNKMVEKENLDVRTITMGINLLDCAGPDLAEVNEKIYNKITTPAKDLVSTGEETAKRTTKRRTRTIIGSARRMDLPRRLDRKEFI